MSSSTDHLDDLDRRIIAALQSDGRASWTEIAELSGSSVATVARRGQQLLREGVVRVAAIPGNNHAGAADLFVLRITCEPGTQMDVLAELVRHADLRFLSLVTGPYDILAELNLRREESLQARIVERILAIDGVQRCDTDLTLHVYKVSHDWSRQLLSDAPPEEVAEAHQCDPSHFDAVDRQIIDLMREDGRSSFRTVAAEVGLNESTVRRRFETLLSRDPGSGPGTGVRVGDRPQHHRRPAVSRLGGADPLPLPRRAVRGGDAEQQRADVRADPADHPGPVPVHHEHPRPAGGRTGVDRECGAAGAASRVRRDAVVAGQHRDRAAVTPVRVSRTRRAHQSR
jgi:DNA-binding Lrp family transcriptional regulator